MQYLNLLFTPISSRSVNVKLSNSRACTRTHTHTQNACTHTHKEHTHKEHTHKENTLWNFLRHSISQIIFTDWVLATCLQATSVHVLWQWKSGPYAHSQFSLNFSRWSLHHIQLYTQECISSFMTKFLEGNFAGSLPLAPCPIHWTTQPCCCVTVTSDSYVHGFTIVYAKTEKMQFQKKCSTCVVVYSLYYSTKSMQIFSFSTSPLRCDS